MAGKVGKDAMGYPKGSESLPAKADTTTCPVCAEPLSARELVVCKRCKTPHHGECWRYNKGCATFGCGSRIAQPVHSSKSFPFPGGKNALTLTFQPGESSSALDWSVIAACGILVPFTLGTLGPLIGLAAMIGWTVLRTLQHSLTKQHTTIDPSTKRIRVSRILARRFAYGHRRIEANEVLELQLNRYDTTLPGVGRTKAHAIHGYCTDGTRVTLWRQDVSMDPDAVETLAERMAQALGTTVRFVEGSDPPPQAEIDALIASHAAAAIALQDSPPETRKPALPAADHEDD